MSQCFTLIEYQVGRTFRTVFSLPFFVDQTWSSDASARDADFAKVWRARAKGILTRAAGPGPRPGSGHHYSRSCLRQGLAAGGRAGGKACQGRDIAICVSGSLRDKALPWATGPAAMLCHARLAPSR